MKNSANIYQRIIKAGTVKKQVLFIAVMLLYAGQSLAQTTEPYNWSNVAVGGGGFVSGIITSKKQPGLIYARTDVGGAYRWDNANSKWIPLTDFASDSQQGIFGVESIAIDPNSPNIVYMSTGISYFNNGKSYILRSTDYGATFTVTDVTSQFKINGNGYGRQDGERLQVDPENSSVLYCGSRANGLFQSNNSGATWTRLNSLNVTTTGNANGVNFVTLDSSSVATVNNVTQTQRLFVGVSRKGNNNLYRSDDGGTTFTALVNPNLLDTMQMPHRAVLSGNGYLYVTYSNGAGPGGTTAEPCNTGQIWKYSITDGTWTNVTPLTITNRVNKPYNGLSIDPANPNRLIASTTNNYSYQYAVQGVGVYGDKIYYSTDGGTNWTDIVSRGFSLNTNGIPWITGQSIHWAGSIEFDPSSANRIFIVSGNGVFINNDITATAGVWNFAVKGIEEIVPQNMVSIPEGPIVSVISDYDGFTQNDPSQYASNRHTPAMGSTSGLAYAVTSKKVIRVASSMYYSNDQGVTWTKTTGALKGTSGQVALSADGNVLLHCPGGSTSTYRSVDNGATWTTVTGLSTSSARPVADGINSDKFYAYNNGPMMVSTNGGVSFTAAGSAGGGGSKVIRTVPGREGHIWVALYGGGLTHSEDSGTSFAKTTNVTYCGAVGIGKALTAGGYETIFIYGTVSGVLGIHRSTDKGATWVRVNDSAHQYGGPGNGQFIQGDMNVYGRVYMSTAGRGIAYGSMIPAKTPTNIKVSSTSIYQKNAVGAIVGILSSAAIDTNSTYTYSLVTGDGSDDNAAFSILGTQLKAAVVFKYADKQTYNIRIRTTTNDGYTFEKPFVINIKEVFSLPDDNFKVSATNETCADKNDGRINIKAVQALNYTAKITLNGDTTSYPFTDSLAIASLNAGAYAVCITVVGQTDYKQCYNLAVKEPQPLSVYAAVNTRDKNVVLDLSGASSYHIVLNGQTQTSSSAMVKLQLVSGRNELMVTTDKDCQGIFKKTITLDNGTQIYPVPFDNTLNVNLGDDPSPSVQINLYTSFGLRVYAKQLAVQGALVQLNLADLKAGIYVIQVKTDKGISSSKIFKK